jgi:hypothetical protein
MPAGQLFAAGGRKIVCGLVTTVLELRGGTNANFRTGVHVCRTKQRKFGRGDGLFGDPDYLLRVVATDLDAYRCVYYEQLASLPGVQRLTSTLVMKDLVGARGLRF